MTSCYTCQKARPAPPLDGHPDPNAPVSRGRGGKGGVVRVDPRDRERELQRQRELQLASEPPLPRAGWTKSKDLA
eukprot:gene14160-11010_t